MHGISPLARLETVTQRYYQSLSEVLQRTAFLDVSIYLGLFPAPHGGAPRQSVFTGIFLDT